MKIKKTEKEILKLKFMEFFFRKLLGKRSNRKIKVSNVCKSFDKKGENRWG